MDADTTDQEIKSLAQASYKYCITITLIPFSLIYFTPITMHLHYNSDQGEPPARV